VLNQLKNFSVIACQIILLLICLVGAILHYDHLDKIPYGFHVDEMAASVDIGCMDTEGVDAHNIKNPVFSNLNYGTPKPPTYIYPAMLWAKFFGFTVASLRAFSVTCHLLGIIGIFFLSRLFFGWQCALLTITVASLSPWTWGMSRVAFESLMAPTCVIWGLFLFFKSPKAASTIISGLFFAAAMYCYPPFRLQTPLMILTLMIFGIYQYRRSLLSWFIFLLSIILPSIPLIRKTLSGELQGRFNNISIFSKDYLTMIHSPGHFGDIVKIFINNYLLHFKVDFLFLSGDPSYVHSTRHFGILGWLDMAALAIGILFLIMLINPSERKNNPIIKNAPLLIFFIVNILLGVTPAALTNSELPNALRITGSWAFMCLLCGFLLWQACERWWPIWIAICIVSILFASAYLNVYFKKFPEEGKGMFSYWTLDQANGLHSDQDWLTFLYFYRHYDYNARYFFMQYRGLSCTQSRVLWEGFRDYLIKNNQYN